MLPLHTFHRDETEKFVRALSYISYNKLEAPVAYSVLKHRHLLSADSHLQRHHKYTVKQ